MMEQEFKSEPKSDSIFRSWMNVLTKPGEESFIEEGKSPTATLSTALMWVLVAGLVSAIMQTLATALLGASQVSNIGQQLDAAGVPPEVLEMIVPAIEFFLSPAGLITSFVMTIIFTLVSFLLGAGLTHLISRMFGGNGTFGRTAYLQSLFVVPVGIVSSLLGIVPGVGGCLGFILAIYNVVLWFFSTKAEHSLTTGKTIGVAIVAGIAFLLFFGCIGGVIGTAFAGMAGPLPQ